MLVTLVVAMGQLCVVGAWSRSVRFSTVLRAAMTGFLVCGPAVAGLEWVFTRLPNRAGLGTLQSLVTLASWTWDPFLEELVKVLPLVVVAWCWPGAQRRLGWTDHLLLGAGLGAGFALFEAALRYAQVPRFASSGTGGYVVVDGLAQTVTVPAVWESLTTWLPTPVVYGAGWLSSGAADAISHLPWTAFAAVAVAWWTRCHGGRRWLAAVLLVLVGALHAGYNATMLQVLFASTWICEGLSWVQHRMGTVLVLVLIAAVVADRLGLARARAVRIDMLLPGEPASGLNPLPVVRAGLVAAPWSTISTWCVVLQAPGRVQRHGRRRPGPGGL